MENNTFIKELDDLRDKAIEKYNLIKKRSISINLEEERKEALNLIEAYFKISLEYLKALNND